MELIERARFLKTLQLKFEGIAEVEAHSSLISGESGIGKTSLVKSFSEQLEKDCKIYHGYCAALFTPRPLALLYDIFLQFPDLQKKEFGARLLISVRTVGHHISSIFFKLDVNFPRKGHSGSCSHGYYYF